MLRYYRGERDAARLINIHDFRCPKLLPQAKSYENAVFSQETFRDMDSRGRVVLGAFWAHFGRMFLRVGCVVARFRILGVFRRDFRAELYTIFFPIFCAPNTHLHPMSHGIKIGQ